MAPPTDLTGRFLWAQCSSSTPPGVTAALPWEVSFCTLFAYMHIEPIKTHLVLQNRWALGKFRFIGSSEKEVKEDFRGQLSLIWCSGTHRWARRPATRFSWRKEEWLQDSLEAPVSKASSLIRGPASKTQPMNRGRVTHSCLRFQ